MSSYEIILRLNQVALIAPGIFIIIWWSKLWKHYSLPSLYTLLVSFEALASVIMAELGVFNHWLIVPIVVANTILLAFIFLSIIHNKVFHALAWVGVGIVSMAIAAEFFVFGSSNQFYPYGTTAQSVFILLVSLVYFYHFREDDYIRNPYKELHFFFAASVVIQFGVIILVNIFSKAALVAWQETQDGSFIYALLKVRYLAIIIGQAFLIYGLWQHRSTPSRSFS